MNNQKKATPYYLIHRKKYNENCIAVEEAFKETWGDNVLFGYSIKTNHHPLLMEMAKKRGWLAEAVSYDEMLQAGECGFGKSQMICNGPVKGEMIKEAIKQRQILNLDHIQEVREVCQYVKQEKIPAEELKIGLRVNFDLEKVCPGETTAGDQVNRFGICYENGEVKRAVTLLKENSINVAGLHMHSSTETRSLHVFSELAKMVTHLIEEYQLDLQYVDMGGGFFGGKVLKGKPLMSEYAQVITEELKKRLDPRNVALVIEPGASVLATAVDYVSGVANIREIRGERIVTLDGTLLHINPFMVKRKPPYDVIKAGTRKVQLQHICGCTCMEMDRFCSIRNEKELTPESQLVFHDAGAYTMAFNSNFIVKVPPVYVTEE